MPAKAGSQPCWAKAGALPMIFIEELQAADRYKLKLDDKDIIIALYHGAFQYSRWYMMIGLFSIIS